MRALGCLLGLFLGVGVETARPADAPERPRVLGISHVALRVSDLAASRRFYQEFLGLGGLTAEAPTAGALVPALIRVSERQYIELRPGLRAEEDRLDHIAFQTDDIKGTRRLLTSRGQAVPGSSTFVSMGYPGLMITDPEDHAIEFVAHPAGGWPAATATAGDAPISRRILHAGILVGALERTTRFYEDILGFREIWRGSRSGTELSWTNMKVPDGGDYVEFMLYVEKPAPDARGTQHHICLEVPDIEEARVRLQQRATGASYSRPLEARIGTNRRRQLNLYDPDGTRVELMEPQTVDGRPVPSSTAPPPRPGPQPSTP